MSYLIWHYTRGIIGLLAIWRNFLEFIWHYFAVRQLFFSLFATWRRDLTSYGRGLDIKAYFEALVLNTASRVVGFFVRSIFILLALLLEFFILVFGAFCFIVWLGFLLIIPIFIGLGFYSTFSGLGPVVGFLLLIFVLSFLLIAFKAFSISRKKPYQEMSLEELAREPWFGRVWRRLGFESGPKEIVSLAAKLKELNFTKEDFELILRWEIFLQQQIEKQKYFWRRESLLSKTPFTKNWAFGYTFHLDKHAVDLTEYYRFRSREKIVAHRQEIEKIEKILSGPGGNNVLLVGEPGSGRTATILALAKSISQGLTINFLDYKRVLDFKIDDALAGISNQALMQEKLSKLLYEAGRAGNVILVIEDIDNYLTQEIGLGKIDLSALLASFLASPVIQIIGTTNHGAYHKYLEPNKALMKYFELVEIKEPDYAHLFFILNDFAWQLEKGNKFCISYAALKKVTEASSRFFQEIPLPQRAINILENTVSFVLGAGRDRIEAADIEASVSEKTGVAIGVLAEGEKQKLLNLEEILHRRLIDQEQAIKEISSAMRRRRLGIGQTKRPAGSFLFLGPTGVGKTETAKTLAEAYFGNENRMIRLDMSEYQEAGSIERLIGSSDGEIVGQLVSLVRDKPFSLLLLDEIEKANKDVLQLFLQVLEDGFLTDGLGRRVSFSESIIIATSNAGAEMIRELVQKSSGSLESEKNKVLDFVQSQGVFRPEFINRFDAVVLYEPLFKENLFKVAQLMLADLAKRLEKQQFYFKFENDLIEKVVVLGYDPTYGARPMRRVLQQKVEDLIAKKVLAGEIQKNQPFLIKADDLA